LESIFYKNNGKKKYDIVFYYDTYTPILGHHFVELEKYIDSSRIDMYERSIIDGSCVYNNKVIGLVSIEYIYKQFFSIPYINNYQLFINILMIYISILGFNNIILIYILIFIYILFFLYIARFL